MQEKSI